MPTAVPPTDSEPQPIEIGDPGPAGCADGRTARSQRTRTAIVDALLGLLDEGELHPTASRIAARAGISLRLIYHHFGDLDSLFRAVAERQRERVAQVWRPIDGDLPLDERIDALVDQRIAIIELVTPVRRAGQAHEPFSTEIREIYSQALATGRAEVGCVFADELRRLPRSERDLRATGIQGVLGWGHWNDLRLAGLTAAQTRATIRAVVAALVAT